MVMRTVRETPGSSARERGFTLIELLAVIAILGILAGLVAGAVGGLGNAGQNARLAGDRVTIGTAVDRFFNLSFPQTYPVFSFDDTDASLRTAGDLGARIINYDSRLPQDPDQTFVPDFLKEIPDSSSIVSWRVDTVRGILYFAREGAQLVPPAETRVDVSASDPSPGVSSAYTLDIRMTKDEASLTQLVLEIPHKYTIGGQGLGGGTNVGFISGSISGDNPWSPGNILNFSGDLKATGVANEWELEVNYPDSMNNPVPASIPSRPDKVHSITIIEPSEDIPGKMTLETDRTGETTEHNLADETWELLIFSVALEGGISTFIITNPTVSDVYRWLAQEATVVDPEDTFDAAPGKQSVIIK